ncbi:hypothetical protein QJS83_13890 [Bdellovibrio sp. 22V]|uniref:hypothetical protein n=1 Tax=Bdellovibrio sp. 22V TaxID=3044166 RepID=UPI002543766C|nr:hypothetical protein [Bdellovibrio sp. 22V]WII71556.1 hypothetical protein QJS83_13890 [Bdellovibrio sp. 22V]
MQIFKKSKALLFSSLISSGVLVTVVAFQNCSPPMQFALPEEQLEPVGAIDPEQIASTCSFNGVIYQEGQTVIAYETSSGTACRSEIRVCTNGAFTGSYRFASCTPGSLKSCLFNGQTILHSQSVVAYQNSTVPYGGSCAFEQRRCQDGVLSGSYAYGSCAIGGAASCLFNGATIKHGSTVTAFQSSSAPFGNSCRSEVRSCNNGLLTGTYSYSSCSVGQASSCLFNGATIPHGQTVTAYLTATVASGSSCSSQVRSCNNGVLSGSYGYSNCAPAPAPTPQAPTFSCNKTAWTCGEPIICTASGSDSNLKTCDYATGNCYPLMGRPDWTYLGNGKFSYYKINTNSGGYFESVSWGALDSNGLRSSQVNGTIKTCMPRFSCSKSYYACGETVSCSASFEGDSGLQVCAPGVGCFSALGRENWSYQGNGSFYYSMVNNNLNTSDATIYWYSRNSQGYDSPTTVVRFGACK